MTKRVSSFVFGCVALVYAASCWALAPIHEAEYLDGNGKLYVVTTFDDGSVTVRTIDGSYSGLDAFGVLARNGIDLTVNPSGHIMGQSLTDGAVLKIKPHLVTNHITDYDRQPTASSQTKTSNAPTSSSTSAKSNTLVIVDAIPSNIAAGTAFETQRYYESATHRGSNSDVVVPEPVSGR